MKKLIYLTAFAGLIAVMCGCSGTSRSGSSGLFGGCSLFRCGKGEACSTCCPPSGQTGNVAPLCDTCGTNNTLAPPPTIADPGVSMYGAPNSIAPMQTSPMIETGRPVMTESEFDALQGTSAVTSPSIPSASGVSAPF